MLGRPIEVCFKTPLKIWRFVAFLTSDIIAASKRELLRYGASNRLSPVV